VIVSAIDDPFFSEILQGIDDIAQQCGYSLFIAASQKDLNRERAIVRTMRQHRVDGLILCSTSFSTEQRIQLNSFEIPLVVINNQSTEEYQYSINHDDLDGSRQVMQHMLDLGHRRIAYLGYAHSGRTNAFRIAGYREQMKSAGLAIEEGYEFLSQTSDPAGGQAASPLPGPATPPTAIFGYNVLAIGLLRLKNLAERT
jgi:DNA-binding LacI/PurR family transcriptional regulator